MHQSIQLYMMKFVTIGGLVSMVYGEVGEVDEGVKQPEEDN